MTTTTRRTRIDTLTPAQRDRMASFAQEWIDRGWRTRPLTEEEWQLWEAGARACYEYAGIPWPGVVVRAPSPIVGAFAAPIAAYEIAKIKRDAVSDAVDGAVGDAVRGAVRDAVRDAVGDAVGGEAKQILETVSRLCWNRLGGIHWSGWWNAYVAYFRDVAELGLPGDLWDRSRAYDDAQSAGWWWPFREFVMVCDAPHTLHLEQMAPTGWGSHRLHSGDGPAVAWDGWGLHYWHGTKVPADLIETGWTVTQIFAEPNAEVRRCAVEIMAERDGWAGIIAAAGWEQIGSAADPGNPGQTLTLYRVPANDGRGRGVGLYNQPVNLLRCTNATQERDGSRHEFGLTVISTITDPVEAAAWTFGISRAQYLTMEHAG